KRFLRLQLTGEELLYDASRREMTVPSPGTLVVEDYRLPKEGAETRPAGEMAGAIVRPWQTLFQWNRLMELKQAERQAIMEGEAIMVHRSGRQIVASLAELGLPDWPKDLEEGRRTRLTCERLLAQFSPADAQGGGQLDVEGPRVGPLELFSATRKVHLTDGARQLRSVVAQRLTYRRQTDIVEVFGFLPGEKETNASILVEDKDAGTSQEFSGSKITWFRTNDKIVAEKITGGGGR
ncbi:MAG TPA: hypothetical protein PK082_10120, partial [Phycisphaerae bacterium]|nr:hypothetical protein [Phycisphaerae bacterium]